MTRVKMLLVKIFMMCFLFGCGSGRTDDSFIKVAYNTADVWQKSRLVVCFLDDVRQLSTSDFRVKIFRGYRHPPEMAELPEKFKRIFEDIINREYTNQKTGIQFTGWQKCSQTVRADVIIVQVVHEFKEGVPRLPLGFVHHNLGNSLPSVIELVVDQRFYAETLMEPEHVFRVVSVHEAGHIAGLVHEDVWPEALSDKKCKGLDRIGEGLTARGRIVRNRYDSRSIMNFCHTIYLTKTFKRVVTNMSLLSREDQMILKKIYGRSST